MACIHLVDNFSGYGSVERSHYDAVATLPAWLGPILFWNGLHFVGLRLFAEFGVSVQFPDSCSTQDVSIKRMRVFGAGPVAGKSVDWGTAQVRTVTSVIAIFYCTIPEWK